MTVYILVRRSSSVAHLAREPMARQALCGFAPAHAWVRVEPIPDLDEWQPLGVCETCRSSLRIATPAPEARGPSPPPS